MFEPDGDAQPDRAGSSIAVPTDDDGGEEVEISAIFRRMLSGLRARPWEERAAALWAARNWLWQARKALRDKREATARARRMQRSWQALRPS